MLRPSMVWAMASKGDRPFRRPVPMTERTAAKNSAPHSDRLTAKGRKPKVALVAVMGKLVTLLNALLC